MSTLTYLGLECVALADREVEEGVTLGCAWVHHCHQLVDALPGNEDEDKNALPGDQEVEVEDQNEENSS